MSFKPIAVGLPVIAIVGRPNVGKSTLFNRLLRENVAITDPTPGVTRDPIQKILKLDGGCGLLVDTGGYTTIEDADSFSNIVSEKSLDVIKQADLILFMLDAHESNALDEDMAKELRRYSDKTILLVNKVDHEKHMDLVNEQYGMGFKGCIPLSAEHGTGIEEVIDAINAGVELVPEGDFEEKPTRRILLLGKPNTGKSTLSNALTGTERSIVSEIPGTTRDATIDHFVWHNQDYSLVDCAGIRRKSKVTEDLEYYTVNRAIKQIEEVDLVFLMVDIEDNITDQDKKIAAQIVKKGKGVIIVLNKTDLLENETAIKQMEQRVSFLFPVLSFAPVICISAINRTGLNELMKEAGIVFKQLHKRIETGMLNRSLKKWLDANPPPLTKTHRKINIKYMTQASSAPLRFVIFAGRKNELPESYRLFIQNKIRKDLGFSKVPFDLSVH